VVIVSGEENMIKEGNMTEETLISLPENITWVKAKPKGKFTCPDCGKVMIVMGLIEVYAYCITCEQYWMGEGG